MKTIYKECARESVTKWDVSWYIEVIIFMQTVCDCDQFSLLFLSISSLSWRKNNISDKSNCDVKAKIDVQYPLLDERAIEREREMKKNKTNKTSIDCIYCAIEMRLIMKLIEQHQYRSSFYLHSKKPSFFRSLVPQILQNKYSIDW